ncbi:tyrosine-type recombinase/integrase [Microbacterium sp. MEC084]|uniref:tyrosine-type recombinase/integrase n=1 Tax=Microbacterium sp. MEC084 TaxID=1963027 RepID=UPI00107026F1|nr:site-specific integrase [Microbacterium sp. MEC084]MCD1267813.1 tyrosine-type recombinase/integrase [Microbacterium sp. MEC084]
MAAGNARIDPKTRRVLPEGIRYRADRNKYQVRVWGTGLNGEDRERSFLVDTLSEAKKLRSEARTQVRPDGAMTLNAWYDRYWPSIESGVRPATARAYDRAWRKRVKPWLGHRRLESITVGDIDHAIAGWGGSASTRNDALSALGRLLEGAARAGIIAANPARLARRPKEEGARSFRSRALTVSEVAVMLDAVSAGPYRDYLAALVYTGMRAGEASALRVGDVDLAGRVIHVRRSFSRGLDGEVVEQTPKSHKERTVPLPAVLRPTIERLIEGKLRGDLVFTGPRGGHLNTSNVRRGVDWDALRKRLDRPDLRIHDLRHTLATLLFDAGTAANDVQAILGHSSLQVTERYSKARSDVAVRAGTALDGLFN